MGQRRSVETLELLEAFGTDQIIEGFAPRCSKVQACRLGTFIHPPPRSTAAREEATAADFGAPEKTKNWEAPTAVLGAMGT